MLRNFDEHLIRPTREKVIKILATIITRTKIVRQAESHVNPGFQAMELQFL